MLRPGLMVPESEGFALQVLSELETDTCQHREYWSIFGEGEQVKLFCKIQLMKDHCCPEENRRELYYLCITIAASKA